MTGLAPGRCGECGRLLPVWTPDAVVAALQQWADEHGRAPTRREWTRGGHGRPVYTTVKLIFGSWNAALKAAGLPQRRRGVTLTGRVWTRERVADALTEWRVQHGDWPRPSDWQSATPEHPHYRSIYLVFESWEAALTAAGKRRAA